MIQYNTEGRRICTKEDPYKPTPSKPERWIHPDATYSHDCSEGCCSYYSCPICNCSFKIEYSQ